MINKKNIINGYILAGGKSSRMGTDKGLMVFNEKIIVQQVIEQMKPAVTKLFIVSNNPEYGKLGLKVIGDVITNIGPAGGIHAALNHSDSNYNFIVSCDMPFVTTQAIEFVIQHAFQSQITLPIHHQKVEPLFGIYTKECLPKWSALIQKRIFKLQDIIAHFSVQELNVDGNELFNDSLFMNINTPSDFRLALKKSKHGN